MSQISCSPLTYKDIPFLQDEDVVYAFDLRGTTPSFDMKIPDFWKYENIMPWILRGKLVAVNENHVKIKYGNDNLLLVCKKNKDPRVSLFERLPKNTHGRRVVALWVGVPHPDADVLAKQNQWRINYTFPNFLQYNNKFLQKEIFTDSSPQWQKVQSVPEVQSYRFQRNGHWLLKCSRGSGGWQVLDLNQADDTAIDEAYAKTSQWYVEWWVQGGVYSIQCLKLAGEENTTIFGFVQQKMDSTTHFIGGRILPLTALDKSVFNQLKKAISKLQPFLHNYEGFFGIDFIINEPQVFVLEANVRMTAMTVPVLVANQQYGGMADFFEDIDRAEAGNKDTIITEDLVRKKVDVLTSIREMSQAAAWLK